MSKTIKEWFEQLPPDVRENAMENTPLHMLDRRVDSMWMAVNNAFIWDDTPQGGLYWSAICDTASRGGYDAKNQELCICAETPDIVSTAVRLGMAVKLLEGWALAMQMEGELKDDMVNAIAKYTQRFVEAQKNP